MRIVIDKREGDLFKKTYEALLRVPEETMLKIDIISEDLPIGDILIQTKDKTTLLVIERKTFPDLLASIKDGRYEEQSHRLLHTTGVPPHSIIYLLEGMFSSIHQPAQKKLIYSAMTSLNYIKGFSIMRTYSVHETGEWIVSLTEKLHRETERGKTPYYLSVPYLNSFRRNALPENVLTPSEQPTEGGKEQVVENGINYCNFVKKVKKENVTPENIGEIVLSQIPGISSVTAIAIMKKFSTFPKLMSALQENPNCLDDVTTENNGKIRKINKSCIENIKKYFI
jgi:ERCC4-type nuclease